MGRAHRIALHVAEQHRTNVIAVLRKVRAELPLREHGRAGVARHADHAVDPFELGAIDDGPAVDRARHDSETGPEVRFPQFAQQCLYQLL